MEDGMETGLTRRPRPIGLNPQMDEIVIWMQDTNVLLAGIVKTQAAQLEVIANLQRRIEDLQSRS